MGEESLTGAGMTQKQLHHLTAYLDTGDNSQLTKAAILELSLLGHISVCMCYVCLCYLCVCVCSLQMGISDV